MNNPLPETVPNNNRLSGSTVYERNQLYPILKNSTIRKQVTDVLNSIKETMTKYNKRNILQTIARNSKSINDYGNGSSGGDNTLKNELRNTDLLFPIVSRGRNGGGY